MTVATVALMRHGGSHLIRPIVSRLGFEIIEPGNFGAPLDQAQGPVIVFLRDPRDRMVATRRSPGGWLHKPRKSEQLMRVASDEDGQLAWMIDDAGFMTEMLRWARIWCRWPGALIVRFENVRSDGCAEVSRIMAHLGLSENRDRAVALFAETYGTGRTYSGRHSDWRESFGPLARAAWERTGGAELLELMGYA